MKTSTRLTLWIILASSTLTVMAGSIIGPVVEQIKDGLQVDPVLAGLIITTHAIFVAIFSPVWGTVIDKIGIKKPFTIGLFLYGLAGGAGLVITSFLPLLISRAIMGIAVAGIYTAVTVAILTFFTGEEKNKYMGWRGSANSIGATIWPLIGGALGVFSWHLPFGVYLVGLPLAFFAIIILPNENKPTMISPSNTASILSIFKKNPVLLPIYSLMFLTNAFLYVNVVFLPQLLAKIGIISSFQTGLFLAVLGLAAGLTSAVYYKIKSKLPYTKISLIALTLWILGFTLLYQTASPPLIAASVALFGIGHGMVLPTIMLWIGDVVPKTYHGRFSSYIGLFGFVGQFSSPLLFGGIIAFLGLRGIFITAAIISLFTLIISLLFQLSKKTNILSG